MHNQGQLGHFLTGVAAFILIFLMTGIFITYSFLTAGNKESAFEQARYYHQDDLMLQQVILDDKVILVYDLVVKRMNEEVFVNQFSEIMKKLVDRENNPCIAMEIGYRRAAESYHYEYSEKFNKVISDSNKRDVVKSDSLILDYREKGISQILKFYYFSDPEEMCYVEYYSDKCLKETKIRIDWGRIRNEYSN